MLRLVAANLNYSSWTIRPWLALRAAKVDFTLHDVGLFTKPNWREAVLQFSGAGKVPVLVDGALTVHESLAICEYIAEKFPEARLWPESLALRARGRAISCEMLSGFPALRNEMPHNLRARAASYTPSSEALAEVARVNDIWTASIEAGGGPYLFGEQFCIADCMYMPVVSRFRSYGIMAREGCLSEAATRYCSAIWEHSSVKELSAIAAGTEPIPKYDVGMKPL